MRLFWTGLRRSISPLQTQKGSIHQTVFPSAHPRNLNREFELSP